MKERLTKTRGTVENVILAALFFASLQPSDARGNSADHHIFLPSSDAE